MHNTGWLNRSEYPFTSRYLDLDAGKMHYIDEGQGPVIVFVHGTPVWSFLYREFIKRLSRSYRCIAMDHLGFGLSDKPAGWTYRPADHARNLEYLIERLGLRDITLVVHDFGGPIGLSYALNHPHNIAGLAIFNTWMWSLCNNQEANRISRVMSGWMGRLLYRQLNFSARFLIPFATGNRARLSRSAHRHYINAAPHPDDRQGMLVCARELVGSSEWYDQLWSRRDRIRDLPALLLWGLKDPGVRSGVFDLARWQGVFASAETITFPEAGHFVQEEEAPAAIDALMMFMRKLTSLPVSSAAHHTR